MGRPRLPRELKVLRGTLQRCRDKPKATPLQRIRNDKPNPAILVLLNDQPLSADIPRRWRFAISTTRHASNRRLHFCDGTNCLVSVKPRACLLPTTSPKQLPEFYFPDSGAFDYRTV
jgi:hypothetical protein